MTLMRTWLHDSMSLVFPDVCEVCGRQLVDGEELICTHCNIALPRIRNHTSDFNAQHQRLAGNVMIDRAAAWIEYHRQSPFVKLIHKAKYHDRPDIARKMGRIYADEIKESGFFDGIDMLLPVPMHWLKEMKRGYNQAAEICAGINDITGIPLGDNLRAAHSHKSQTRRNSYDRHLNVADLFTVIHANELSGQHILVVDDVLTTGATLHACCEALANAVPDVNISILTLASTTRQ